MWIAHRFTTAMHAKSIPLIEKAGAKLMPTLGRPRCRRSRMSKIDWLQGATPAFRLAIATSWLAPDWWRQNQERAIREAMAAGPDWTEFVSLVVRHQTPTLSWAALNRVPRITIPDHAKRELQTLSDACRMQGTQDSLLLIDMLKRLNRAGIPVMPIKGQYLSFELYGDLGLRHSLDLDVEVAREDLGRAQACLESKDWHLDSAVVAMSPRQWEGFLRNEHEMHFVHSPTGRCLELHWRNHREAPEATSARWARSVPSVWQRCSIRAMSTRDLTLHLCHHGGIHLWSRAKWLGDLARAHSLGLLDWRSAWDDARLSGEEHAVLVGWCLLHEVYGLPVPDLPENASMDRSSSLIRMPLQSLKAHQALADCNGLGLIRNRLRTGRYERLLRPQKTWRDSLSEVFYCQQDFAMLPLPDSLFWAYKPLRPLLWLWRWAWQAWRLTLERNALKIDRQGEERGSGAVKMFCNR